MIDDVRTRLRIGFAADDEVLLLLGGTRADFGGSEWAHVVHDHLGGRPPAVDFDAERALGALLCEAAAARLVTAAHDLSDGGLAQALVESCLRGGRGARVTLPAELEPAVALFSETAARAVVVVERGQVEAVVELARTHGVPAI